jgi:hypothetical protein
MRSSSEQDVSHKRQPVPEVTEPTPPDEESPGWTIIAAVNNEEVLKSCLLSSPDVRRAGAVILQSGRPSAALAYNAAIEKVKTDVMMFVHQDVYLPEGWVRAARSAVDLVSRTDPDWGVLGCWGMKFSGERAGFVYDGGWRRVLGHPFSGGVEVETLDEVLLIVRKSSGLRFDERIGGFHMYGADICLEARRRGRRCYAIAAFCLHNTNQYGMLPLAFWQAYLAMRRKWKAQLPIKTTCVDITRWCWPMYRWNVVRAINLATGRDESPAKRINDPAQLYYELVNSGKISPVVSPVCGRS